MVTVDFLNAAATDPATDAPPRWADYDPGAAGTGRSARDDFAAYLAALCAHARRPGVSARDRCPNRGGRPRETRLERLEREERERGAARRNRTS